MLYTSYLSKLSKLPDDARKILIMRWAPRNIDISKYDLEHEPRLSPSALLLARLKDNSLSFQEFVEIFKDEMLSFDFQTALDSIREDLDNGKDVIIICCEKDPLDCHRFVISNSLKEEGYECREW